jgi:ribosome-interacting GTPase 1
VAANLTPQYLKAEEEYRRAATSEDELKWLQVMLRELPKHKASEKMQSELKQKISRAKSQVETDRKKGKSGHSQRIPRQGAGTAIILGGPNSGKSQLMTSLTRATPEVAPYPFTTHAAMPGMMNWEDVQIQLIDTPPITANFFDPIMQGLIRSADVVVLMVDLGSDDGIEQLQELLDQLGNTKTRLDKESRLDPDDLGLSYTQTLLVPNKIDLADAPARLEILHELCPLDFPEQVISCTESTGLEDLRTAIYRSLGVIRIYTRQPGQKEPDKQRPFTIRHGGTVLDVAALVHHDFVEKLKSARIWGSSVHPGETVKGDHVLDDTDIVELHV